MPYRVAVVQGGPSSEAEVSRVSAKFIAEALRRRGHTVLVLELDAFLQETLRQSGVDAVFPIAHGALGEDGALQGLIDTLGFPYVGSGVLASALAMDKPMAKVVFAAANLRTANGCTVQVDSAAPSAILRVLGSSLVVKPATSGSGLGVTLLPNATEESLANALSEVSEVARTALVEELIVGREVTCGVLEKGKQRVALPPTEILSPEDSFYNFQARYTPGRSRHICPAELPKGLSEEVQRMAILAHEALGCRDLSRADFVVTGTEAVLLEVNTLPGFTSTSLFPEACAQDGLEFGELCEHLVARALTRGVAPRFEAARFPASRQA